MDSAPLARPAPRQLRYGLLASCVAHASLWQFAAHSYAPPLRAVATAVEIELAETPARAPPLPAAAVAPASDTRRPRRAKAARPRAVTAAEAPQLEPVAALEADAPADFTSGTLVVAQAAAAHGTASRAAASATPGALVAAQASASDLSNAVALEEASWSCPWPRDAEAELIDEQVVVIRVVVAATGAVESAALLADPGRGFGAAAVACALRTRFTPALDREGKRVRAQSPPIRVTFTR